MASSGNSSGSGSNGQSQNPDAPFRAGDMPPELVELVFDHSGPVDGAAMAFACKDLKKIGNINFEDFWKDQDAAWEFLQRLEPEANPRLVPCRECLSLHSPQFCLPSFDGDGEDMNAYKCRSVRTVGPLGLGHPMRSPDFLLNIQPALYAMAKYIRLGLDTSFFAAAEKDREDRYRVRFSLSADDTTWGEVWEQVNVNQHGLFWRQQHVLELKAAYRPGPNDDNSELDYIHSWLNCYCHRLAPRLWVYSDPAGKPVCTVYGADKTNGRGRWFSSPQKFWRNTARMLPEDFHVQPSQQAPLKGTIIGCENCGTEMRAEVRFRPDNTPQLVLTTWEFRGEITTPDSLQANLNNILRCVTLHRLPGAVGKVAELSGMMQD
ncbi:hypothetical protein PG997_002722 [Apiospora hydei]|uniref:F-box domain-containing protein n=1 Tax=Apiospora hydei TaxID=1337664 RepID=A0ABR1WX76_9PEZI